MALELIIDDVDAGYGAVRALAGYDDARISPTLLDSFTTMKDAEKSDALAVLATTYPLNRMVGRTFIPDEDTSEFTVHMDTPQGTSLEGTTEIAKGVAALLISGGLIGIERERRGKAAGFRTNTLICLGSAIYMFASDLLFLRLGITNTDPTRIAAQIVTGIGFLGAGVIMKEGLNIRGLNTAATLWGSAAAGGAAGADLIVEAVLIAAFVLAGLFAPLLSPADPYEQSLRLRFRPPVWEERGSWAHPLGTDRLGRDMLSRLMWGARTVLTVAPAAVIGAATLGTLLAGDTGATALRLDALPVSAIGEAMLAVAAALTLLTGWDYVTASLRHVAAPAERR